MAQRFVGLEEAAAQLGVSKERLNEIREAGEVRAYRDGASWKFRTEDIDKLAAEMPAAAAEDEEISFATDEPSSFDLSASGLDLTSDDLDLTGAPTEDAPVSDLDLASLDEPTVPAESEIDQPAGSGGDLAIGVEPIAEGDDAESILLSEDELGDSPDRPPSTIIGRSQLRDEASDDDLELSITGEDGASDVTLAESVDEVLGGPAKAGAADKFENLEELEIDLEAESSRILEAQDVAAAQAAAAEAERRASAPSSDDLVLESGSSTGFQLESTGSSDPSATGVHEASAKPPSDADAQDAGDSVDLQLEGAGASGAGSSASDIVLQEDGSDDFVLGSGSDDFTLSSADSGINLKPSDSGLALDDAQLDLGGSAVGSSLDLGGSLSESDSLASSGSDPLGGAAVEFEAADDFNLQPLAEEDEEEEEDSSQIIELDAVEEPVGEEVAIGEAAAMGMAASPDMRGAGSPMIAPEASFSVWNVAGLAVCGLLMLVTGVMMLDILRTMWAWNEPLTAGSPLIETLLGIVGMN